MIVCIMTICISIANQVSLFKKNCVLSQLLPTSNNLIALSNNQHNSNQYSKYRNHWRERERELQFYERSILVEIIVLLNVLGFICLVLFVLFQNEASVPHYFASFFVCNHIKKELGVHYYTNKS